METLDCGHEPSPHSDFTTGYGTDAQGKKHCYACCAESDKRSMVETGRATLYLTHHAGWKISNWPGSLEFRPQWVATGKHNIARVRRDARFIGPDGKPWHAVQYGDNTQTAHCRRVKA